VFDGLVVAADIGEGVGDKPGEGFGVVDGLVADDLPVDDPFKEDASAGLRGLGEAGVDPALFAAGFGFEVERDELGAMSAATSTEAGLLIGDVAVGGVAPGGVEGRAHALKASRMLHIWTPPEPLTPHDRGQILATPQGGALMPDPAPNPTVTVRVGTDPCPRCSRTVVLTAHITLGDGFDLHLCRRCDAGATAGGRLLAVLGLPDGQRPMDLFREFTAAWLRDGAAVYGWHQVPPAD
jgi:hypothetical protein